MTKIIKAGTLEMQYESGSLRYIRSNGREIIRSIYFALRDNNWGTVPFRIEDEHNTIIDDAFHLTFTAVHHLGEQEVFRWHVRIIGTAQHEVEFAIEGVALQTFWRNRAGFCVLHPIEECAGQPLQITQPNGEVSLATFPEVIASSRPFPYIKAMRWEVQGEATLTFEGDDFETEDQRNWGDGSYKTFCTPLAIPFPVELKIGGQVTQKISLQYRPQPTGPVVQVSQSNAADPIKENKIFPQIGTLQAFEKAPFTNQEKEALRALHLEHLRVEVNMNTTDWKYALEFGYEQAQSIDAPLFLSLTFGPNAPSEVAHFLDFVQKNKIAISQLLLFQQDTYATPTALLISVVEAIRRVLPKVKIGAGTQSNYTELGRHLFDASAIDFIAYGFQPQEHAFDDLSLIENIESQASAVFSTQYHYPNKAIYTSPVTLKKRFNPYAQYTPDHFVEQPLSVQYDARLCSDFGAGWLLSTLKTLAEAGVETITLGRATGALGLVQTEPIAFYEILKKIQSLKGSLIRPFVSSDKLKWNALVCEKANITHAFVVNHTAFTIHVPNPCQQDVMLGLKPFEVKYLSTAAP